MELSKRLAAVVHLVTRGNSVADVGCDHGYLSIYLRENEISPRVIALDVNQGPLAKAMEHIAKYGCSGIETRLSNGLDQLQRNEVDTIICAGMGGRLILGILEHDLDYARSVEECILQPQSELSVVRQQLVEWGFHLVEEDMIYEDGKYYSILKVSGRNCKSRVVYTKTQYEYGPLLLSQQNPCLHTYLRERRCHYEKLIKELSIINRTQTQTQRIGQLEEELERIIEALKSYDRIS